MPNPTSRKKEEKKISMKTGTGEPLRKNIQEKLRVKGLLSAIELHGKGLSGLNRGRVK